MVLVTPSRSRKSATPSTCANGGVLARRVKWDTDDRYARAREVILMRRRVENAARGARACVGAWILWVARWMCVRVRTVRTGMTDTGGGGDGRCSPNEAPLNSECRTDMFIVAKDVNTRTIMK